jgi:hypothetical protein
MAKWMQRWLGNALMGLAYALSGLPGSTRRTRVGRWRLALWALSVALITGVAGGVSVAEAESVGEPEIVSCYCTALPPRHW